MAFGINLIGYATANFGLGVALRNTAALLGRLGIPFAILDIDPGGNRTGHEFPARARFVKSGEPLPYPVNLFHFNPPAIEGLLRDLPGMATLEGKFNVCAAYWELPRLPADWPAVLDRMDLVLAPSRFIMEAMEASGVRAPVRYYRQTLELPPAESDRARWGFREGNTAFLFSFDLSSGLLRKNPLAVLRAFALAFPDGRAQLLIKANNPDLSPEARIVLGRLESVAAGAPNIRFLGRSLAYPEMASLYASADVYVSLHRSEGLGLGMLECMALGKPVIATAWSGNMDFMDASNACLVPHDLSPLDPGTQYFQVSKGVAQVWAEPSIEAAAGWMARLDASPALRAEIGARARVSSRSFLAEAEIGTALREIETRWRERGVSL
jgi:glycosyltransferase involved in cell wall biosynthesis